MDTRSRYWWLCILVVVALSSASAEAQLSQFWSAEVLDPSPHYFLGFNNRNQALGPDFIWNVDDATRTSLGSFGGGWTSARDINNLGHVVGSSLNAAGVTVPFLWDPENGMRDLSVLAGVELWPTAINDHGQIVGTAFTPTVRSLLWDPLTGLHDLGNLDPVALNNNGQVVGNGWGAAEGEYAAIWDRVNGVQNLGPGRPKAINDNGEVAGEIDGWD